MRVCDEANCGYNCICRTEQEVWLVLSQWLWFEYKKRKRKPCKNIRLNQYWSALILKSKIQTTILKLRSVIQKGIVSFTLKSRRHSRDTICSAYEPRLPSSVVPYSWPRPGRPASCHNEEPPKSPARGCQHVPASERVGWPHALHCRLGPQRKRKPFSAGCISIAARVILMCFLMHGTFMLSEQQFYVICTRAF